MSDITAEKKLELIRNIREENSRNRMNLRSRENILYGQNYDNPVTNDSVNMTISSEKSFSTLGIRIFTAIILFSLFIILDYTKQTWFSLDSVQICKYLQENYTLNSFDFIQEITYTLEDAAQNATK